MGEIKRKRGRPREEGSMREQFHMFMSKDMSERLNNLSRITGMSRADIFREAFDSFEKWQLIQHEEERDEEEIGGDEYGYYDEFDEDFDE